MSGKHMARRNVRRGGVLAAVAGLSALALTGVALAGTTPAPDPADCTALLQALITAQVAQDGKSGAVVKAQRADEAARAVFDRAATDAQTQYKSGQPYHGTIDPKIQGDTQAAADARADAAAQQIRDGKITTAGRAYQDGKTAGQLADAKAAERKTSGVLADIKLDLGKVCVRKPVPATTATPAPVVIEAPAPSVVPDTNLPVTH